MLPSKHDNFSKKKLPKNRFDILKLHCICMYNSSSVNLINYVLLYDRSGRKKIVVWLENRKSNKYVLSVIFSERNVLYAS